MKKTPSAILCTSLVPFSAFYGRARLKNRGSSSVPFATIYYILAGGVSC